MPDRLPTVWHLDPHTGAKHDILRKYLGAWFPKLAWAKRLVFIDGFAGPGEYVGGEQGSPLIALNAAVQHKADLSGCELIYIFIEQDKDRFDHLEALLNRQTIPEHVRCQAVQGAFADHMTRILDPLDELGSQMAPAFVMIDPFGFAGLPLDLIARVADHPRTELLISLMYQSLVRWGNQAQLASTVDQLFGCPDWRQADDMPSPSARKDFLVDLYMRRLRDIGGMEYRRAFEMMDKGSRTEYFLIFATHHIDGLKAMKRAMWTVDPSGSFQFSDATVSSQLALFSPEPNFDQLKRLIVRRFSGHEVAVEEIELFVVIETPFMESHFKRQILSPMEKNHELTVMDTPRKNRYTYPPGTVIRFL